jgi:putative multiple sugar transport system substrate-binding protein
MVGQILLGKAVDVNDTKTYDNGAGIVPAYLCTGTAVTVDNYRKLLIDSGIYTEEMLKG